MSSSRTLFQTLNDSPDSKIVELMFKLFKTHKLNHVMINRAYKMYLDASKKEAIIDSVKVGGELSGKELSGLFELSIDNIFDIFEVRKDDKIKISDFPIMFERFKLYNMNYVFSNEELCHYILLSLSLINNIIKERAIRLSKTSFYKMKSLFLIKMYNLGYMTECHKESREEETFFALSFSINGKTYQFHQKSDGFFSTIKETKSCKCSNYERPKMDTSSISDSDLKEMICLLKYIYLKYLKYYL